MAAEWGGLTACSWTRITSEVQQMTASSSPQLMQLNLVLAVLLPTSNAELMVHTAKLRARAVQTGLCGVWEQTLGVTTHC